MTSPETTSQGQKLLDLGLSSPLAGPGVPPEGPAPGTYRNKPHLSPMLTCLQDETSA